MFHYFLLSIPLIGLILSDAVDRSKNMGSLGQTFLIMIYVALIFSVKIIYRISLAVQRNRGVDPVKAVNQSILTIFLLAIISACAGTVYYVTSLSG